MTARRALTAAGGQPAAVIYLASGADLAAAQFSVGGRPVVFRAIAGAVRAGATPVLVPAVFRELLTPALDSAPRVARAVEWLDATTLPPGDAVLIPATAIVGPGALAVMLAARPPAAHQALRDAGVAIVTAPAALVSSLWPALAAGAPVGPELDKTLTDPAITVVADRSLVHAVYDPKSAQIGERRLYATLGSAIDTWFDTVFHRRFSRLVSRLAVAVGIAPNAITFASLLVGLAATWMFWQATPAEAILGLVVYAVAVILDHADGEVARLTMTDSPVGAWLDIVVDTIIHSGVVLALGVTSATVAGGGMALGIAAAVGIVASAAVMKAWPGLAMPDRLGTAIAGIGNRDGFYVMLVAFIAARALWPNALPWLMIVIAVGSHAYWISRVLYRLTRGA